MLSIFNKQVERLKSEKSLILVNYSQSILKLIFCLFCGLIYNIQILILISFNFSITLRMTTLYYNS